MRLFKLGAALLLVAACSSPTDLPDGPPSADGSVITVSASSVHIRGASEQCGIVFRINDDTRILLKLTDGTIERAAMTDVTAGRRAQGWASGAIAESCPAQAGADVVLLI